MITSALLLAGWGGGPGWGWPVGWLFGVGWLVFWVLVILACGGFIFRARRWGWRGPAWSGQQGWHDQATRPDDPGVRDDLEPARKIVRERYARGEISTEEYRERLDNLG
ncbi:MAG TPA: SHOCT domain-containing protein [Candidatus Dormibacteraeota bacterium]|jgi:putative membrane protein|nr:SHOCT domain-containing protein [Candidatus Dormibacteraeota bacterium]